MTRVWHHIGKGVTFLVMFFALYFVLRLVFDACGYEYKSPSFFLGMMWAWLAASLFNGFYK